MRTHQYECGKCGLRSVQHFTRSAANRAGQIHRDEVHGGMHPVDEAILSHAGRMPSANEWPVFVIFAALILAGLVSKAIT